MNKFFLSRETLTSETCWNHSAELVARKLRKNTLHFVLLKVVQKWHMQSWKSVYSNVGFRQMHNWKKKNNNNFICFSFYFSCMIHFTKQTYVWKINLIGMFTRESNEHHDSEWQQFLIWDKMKIHVAYKKHTCSGTND